MAPLSPEPEASRQPGEPPAELAALTARIETLERQVAQLLRHESVSEPAKPLAPSSTQPLSPPPPPRFIQPPSRQSLEDRLGSQIFSRVGIIALLVGTTWFLKWAIDNQWIGQTGRVLIGLLAGAGLILWSERFRRKGFPAFSYTLKAVGSGVLYLALWAAFQLYHLLPAPVALAAMILVTAWNAWMAWTQDAELLAAYALIGGYATPILLSTGGNHEVFLFLYLAAIDLATIFLVRLKPWPRLLVPSILATATYFAGWYFTYFSTSTTSAQDQLLPTLVFLALFFVLFAAASLKPHPDAPSRPYGSVLLDVLIPLANAAFTAIILALALNDSHHHDLLPWAAVLLAAIYLGLMRLQRTAASSAVHLSLAVVFLTIAIPLKATGRWITIGWLVEGTALLWASRRLTAASTTPSEASVYRALRVLAVASLALGFFALVWLPFWLYGRVPTAFFNDRFATSLAGIAAFGLSIAIARSAPRQEASRFWPQTAIFLVLALNLIALQAGVTEIVTFFQGAGHTVTSEAALQTNLSISAFLAAYGAALLAVGFSRRSAFLRWQGLILLVFTIAKVFLYDVSGLSQGYRVASFLGLGALLLAVSFAYQKNLLGLREITPAPPPEDDPNP